jgi:Zn-dependent protease
VPEPAARPRPPGTFKIGTVAGSDVLVSSSWFLVAGLIAVIVAPRIEASEPGLGALKYVAGFAFAVILYLSVLLHEASHAVVAQRLGFPVGSITLHFLGGMTSIEGEARRPRQEFLIAVVGPLTSLAVGVAALGLRLVTPDGLLLVAVEGLAGANLLVGLLNLVPGLPLDGGRVLKAAVWGLTGSVHRGTIVAGWAGRVTAAAAMAWPLAQESLTGVESSVVDFVLAFIVAGFLWSGATAAITSARLRARIPHLVAGELA